MIVRITKLINRDSAWWNIRKEVEGVLVRTTEFYVNEEREGGGYFLDGKVIGGNTPGWRQGMWICIRGIEYEIPSEEELRKIIIDLL